MDEPSKTDQTRTHSRRGPIVLIVIVSAWLGLMMLTSPPREPAVVCDSDRVVDNDTLVMLSASWCGYCRRARNYFHAENIRYCEYDVETNAEGRRQYSALSVKLVPVLKIRGDTLFGFNRDEVQQTLMAHGLVEFD